MLFIAAEPSLTQGAAILLKLLLEQLVLIKFRWE